MKKYIITFMERSAGDQVKMAEFVNMLHDWFHYTDGTYIVKCKEDIEALSKLVKVAMGDNALFLIIKIAKPKMQGYLPKDAWAWLKKNI